MDLINNPDIAKALEKFKQGSEAIKKQKELDKALEQKMFEWMKAQRELNMEQMKKFMEERERAIFYGTPESYTPNDGSFKQPGNIK